jgi:hypothetical protein
MLGIIIDDYRLIPKWVGRRSTGDGQILSLVELGRNFSREGSGQKKKRDRESA